MFGGGALLFRQMGSSSMRHFSGEFEGIRLLMLDELEAIAGGDGEDTDSPPNDGDGDPPPAACSGNSEEIAMSARHCTSVTVNKIVMLRTTLFMKSRNSVETYAFEACHPTGAACMPLLTFGRAPPPAFGIDHFGRSKITVYGGDHLNLLTANVVICQDRLPVTINNPSKVQCHRDDAKVAEVSSKCPIPPASYAR